LTFVGLILGLKAKELHIQVRLKWGIIKVKGHEPLFKKLWTNVKISGNFQTHFSQAKCSFNFGRKLKEREIEFVFYS
jgi:hypothetical protein